eukprot:9935102-Alexandrium_andersonii.AAC.1
MVHAPRVAPTLRRLGAFARVFHMRARRLPTVRAIATDASPWGTGSVLSGPRGIVEYFGAPIAPGDLRRFRAATRDP